MQITQRHLVFGPHELVSRSAEAGSAPYLIAGPHMYALGYGSADIAPIGVEHLVGEMGGIWAHPCKVADGLEIQLYDAANRPLPYADARLVEQLSAVRWEWRADALTARRSDWITPDAPAYVCAVELHNSGANEATGWLEVRLPLYFLGCWFGGIESGAPSYRAVENLLLGEDARQPGWGIALGSDITPASVELRAHGARTLAILRYAYQLAPGEAWHWRLLLLVAHSGGSAAAAASWQRLAAAGHQAPPASASLLAGLPRLTSADANLSRDLALAQANLRLLLADYPDLGSYFLAGLPEYPQLFGCDTTYSVVGAVASGFGAPMRNTLATLARYAAQSCGRVPHEVTTNGRVFNPGNIQETPQYTIAVWDYLRWTGDIDFARQVFPICREGMTALLPAHSGLEGCYPYGDGMVERLGMGSRKLDSACYTIAGLRALSQIAEAIGAEGAAEYRKRANDAHAAFERDWWLPEAHLYADSMHSGGELQFDGHWTAVLPVQLGLAAPERAAQVLAEIERSFVNQWGLVHTRDREEAVWTLPTGLLALDYFQHGYAGRGLSITQNIASTAAHGTLGTFKELIPEGLCFIQLWSAGLYLQAIIEGLMGLQPNAPAHELLINPCIPFDLSPLQISDLRIGEHHLDLTVGPHMLQLTHTRGPAPLAVRYRGETIQLEPGQHLERVERGDAVRIEI